MSRTEQTKRRLLNLATAAVLVSSLSMGGQVSALPNTGGGTGGTGPIVVSPTGCETHCSYFIVWVSLRRL